MRAGIQPLWSSEIDEFCQSVTRRHFPATIQLGDITKLDSVPHVDIIAASSPCQDLSVAGKRGGLQAERSGLFFKAIELVRRANPSFFVWENVPGALSSNGGADFRTVLEEILQESVPVPGHWSNAGVVDGQKCQLAYRLLNAEHWGVPQRRRRIFLVADFAGRRAAEILFEPAGVRGNSASSPKPQRETSCAAGIGTVYGLRQNATCDNSRELSPALSAKPRDFVAYDITHTSDVARTRSDGKINSLNARMGTGGNQVPLIQPAYAVAGNIIGRQSKNGGHQAGIHADVSCTLTAIDRHAVVTQFVRRLTPLECERLQGLPDGWTEGGSDTKRYKALGNGLAQPCVDFILRRIKEVTA